MFPRLKKDVTDYGGSDRVADTVSVQVRRQPSVNECSSFDDMTRVEEADGAESLVVGQSIG